MSLRRLLVALLVLLAWLATINVSAQAQGLLAPPPDAEPKARKAAALPDPCIGPALTVACGVADAAGDGLGEAISAGADAAGDLALNGLSGWVAEGAAWLIDRIARAVERSTRPELGATWFDKQYRSMLSLALLLALGFLLIAIAHAALRQDAAAGMRAALVALPVAICCAFAAVTFVELALAATDEATAIVTSRGAADSREFFSDLAEAVRPADNAQGAPPGFLVLLGGLLAALLCFVVWIELILREAAIYLAVAFLPLSLAAMVWERTAHLARRLVEGLAAIVLAKFTIAASVALAASALGNARGDSGGITTLLAGCAVLFLAALSPWVILRVIPLSGGPELQRGSVKRALGSAPGAAGATSVVRSGMRVAFAAPAGPAAAAGAGLAGGGGAATSSPWKPSASRAISPAGPRPTSPPTVDITKPAEKQGARRGE